MICFASEMYTDYEDIQVCNVYKYLHSVDFFWSESYAMFESLMRNGVNGIYYRDD